MKKINRNMRGFTLVEIMIVVAIILIISAAAFTGVAVTLSNAQEKQTEIKDHADNFEIAARTQIKNLEAGVVDWTAIPKYTPKKKADREVAALMAFGWKAEEIEVTYGDTGYVVTKTWNPDLHDGKTYDEYVAEKNKTNTTSSSTGTTSGSTGTTSGSTGTTSGSTGTTSGSTGTSSGSTQQGQQTTTQPGTKPTSNAPGSSVNLVQNDNNGWHSNFNFNSEVTRVVIVTDSKNTPSVNDNGKYKVNDLGGGRYEIVWQAEGWGVPKSKSFPFNVSNDTTYVVVESFE